MSAETRAKKATKHATLAARTKKPTRANATHANRKASVVQEESATPSRKSTRKSSNHGKPNTNLELREQRATRTPTRRATTSRVRATKVRGKAR